ncbi:uncharacterized protein LOC142818054 [Rhipicephalus microplus]|uniref:uncharacterized protein LOC142818054 n=1 Tax=Rhipicephalus microplus TaxID=6941 RepID=UPI003F6A91B3
MAQPSSGPSVQMHAPEEHASFVAQKDSHSQLEFDQTTPDAASPLKTKPSESPNTGGSEATPTGCQVPEDYVINAAEGASDVPSVKPVLPTSLPEKLCNSCQLNNTSNRQEKHCLIAKRLPPHQHLSQHQQGQNNEIAQIKRLVIRHGQLETSEEHTWCQEKRLQTTQPKRQHIQDASLETKKASNPRRFPERRRVSFLKLRSILRQHDIRRQKRRKSTPCSPEGRGNHRNNLGQQTCRRVALHVYQSRQRALRLRKSSCWCSKAFTLRSFLARVQTVSSSAVSRLKVYLCSIVRNSQPRPPEL